MENLEFNKKPNVSKINIGEIAKNKWFKSYLREMIFDISMRILEVSPRTKPKNIRFPIDIVLLYESRKGIAI